ncbi:uncharacterized protein zgc:113229 [Epinephelus fuscoguttatus]|uniref:uncharacterized protein zgc:113229 n=1 Tax=Epinephelus fuscoguttatus TaxID=293821 RepID=UPI0020D1535B|nr:uncharacterized protein zgc:113229 [Epinephelus fuscoguttatus]XP_049441559.1 uncharacterized protein zgc:113229 [Epinephelus fuscoguttatus]
MSQSRDPKDSQALLQSMLQRLKLQPGREGQPYLHTPVPSTAASTWRQGGEKGASSSPVNGFEFGANGIPSKEFGFSAADSKLGLKGGEIQQPGRGSVVDGVVVSFPSQKDNTDGGTGEDRVLGQVTQPGITPTGTGQLFPAKSLKDGDITSFDRTNGERGSFGRSSSTTRNIPSDKDAVTNMGQNQDQFQGFTPKVYTWALKPTDTGSQENEVSHMGNGGFGALAQSKDMQIVPAKGSARRKQRPSENKTRRWTQMIKERWRDRPGSFGKKGKEEGRVDQRSEGTEISPQNQQSTMETFINTSNKEEERTLPSQDISGPSNTPHTDGSTNEGFMRSMGDFEFGLGSFSLLDEIVTGQEWGKFLNPNLSGTTANQRPSEFNIPTNPYDSGQSSSILNQHGGVTNQWSFRGTEGTSPDLDFSMAQISPDAFQPVSMDVSEGKQAAAQDVQAVRTEPMEHGRNRRPPSSVQPEDILNSALKKRVSLSRKRQHQSADNIDGGHDGKGADREASTSSLRLTSNHVMDETGESQHDDLMPLHTLHSPPPPPLSPSAPFAPAPRGVLKHSISHDSQCSMETATKRRRVEENRRVHFSEEVVTIEPPVLEMDGTDSEEDSGADEDSVIEQDSEEEGQVAMEEVAAPARRAALPAWIRALKRKNTGRKLR